MEESKLVELKPCPFCGSEPTLVKQKYGLNSFYWFVKCENCNAEINNPRFSELEAIGDWNKRAKVMSPNDFKNEMEKITKEHDWEDRHLKADTLMGNLLNEFGYEE